MMKSLTEMTAEIAIAQASHSVMSAEDMEGFLKKTFQVLNEIKTLEEGVEPGPETSESPEIMVPEKSIQKNKVICLECGREFKLLSNRHLIKEHNMDAKEYRKKYGFSARQPLAAKSFRQNEGQPPKPIISEKDSKRKGGKTQQARKPRKRPWKPR